MSLRKQTFPVTGMTCASCVASVERALQQAPGVAKASVNLATNSALVEFAPSETDFEHLRTAVQHAGYDLITEVGADAEGELEAIAHRRVAALKKKLIYAALFSVPLMVVGMGFMHAPWSPWVQWLLATPVLLFFGRQFFVNAWKQAKHRTANMDTLVALSTGVAYAFSVFNVLVPSFWIGRGLEPHVYFETAAVVITFILLGKFLEERAKAGTSGAIKKLMGLRPSSVLREENGGSHGGSHRRGQRR
jgi:Cu2+-exporting ATPase